MGSQTAALLMVLVIFSGNAQQGRRNRLIITQPRIPDTFSFPCEITKSTGTATSVHRLRPSDVRVIGGIGDSMLAAIAALGRVFPFSNMIENAEVSFGTGGAKTWREYLTLPNILKVYNPDLQGFSDRAVLIAGNVNRLTIAKSTFVDGDALMEARMLVRRIKKNRKIDFYNDWKVITLMTGHTNLCAHVCFDLKKNSAEKHQEHIREALDYLQANLPRTFVNLVPVMDVSVLRKLRERSTINCFISHHALCLCPAVLGMRATELSWQYREKERQLISSGRYDNSDNFTVVIQPFTMMLSGNVSKATLPDVSHVTPDCMHLNQKGHALAAQALWNNMLEPVGRKSTILPMTILSLKCPSKNAPYFFTEANSRIFIQTGRQ